MTYPSGKDALETIYRKLQNQVHQEFIMEKEQEEKMKEQEKRKKEQEQEQEQEQRIVV